MAATGIEQPDEIQNQENVSARRRSRLAKQVRHRASVACASCRDRRIRCVVPKGETSCTQCQRSGTACIIKNDDERRRPISKAYMSSLSERIQLLEGMLLSQGVTPPPAVHPPKTRKGGLEEEKLDQKLLASPESLRSLQTDLLGVEEMSPESEEELFQEWPGPSRRESDSEQNLGQETCQQGLVHKMLAGNLPLNQLPGQLELPQQAQRAKQILGSLAPETHSHLMDCFWAHYNTMTCLVNRAEFEADREAQNTRFYTSFLHIVVLAMGFRFADRGRPDMRKISVGNYESTLQREAKYMLDMELERPAGIPSVQALLLLSELECGVGRDNTGWMYASMANRLICSLESTDRERSACRMVSKAALVLDRYCALFLKRPPSTDLAVGKGSRGSSQEIFEYFIELMGLSGKIDKTRDRCADAYLHVTRLDCQLQDWHRRLPDHLAWKPANIKTASMDFFLLHQQYHASLILLHRPWADAVAGLDASHAAVFRGICSQQAVCVSRIFWQHRQCLDGRRMHILSMQHASTAAMALVSALANHTDCVVSPANRLTYINHLDILSAVLADMRHVYQPAARMDGMLQLALRQLRGSVQDMAETSALHQYNFDFGATVFKEAKPESRHDLDFFQL